MELVRIVQSVDSNAIDNVVMSAFWKQQSDSCCWLIIKGIADCKLQWIVWKLEEMQCMEYGLNCSVMLSTQPFRKWASLFIKHHNMLLTTSFLISLAADAYSGLNLLQNPHPSKGEIQLHHQPKERTIFNYI